MRRPLAALLAVLCLAPGVAGAVPVERAPIAGGEVKDVVLYQVRGEVDPATLEYFGDVVRATLNDPRGWSLGGAIHYAEVSHSDELRIWLASPQTVAEAAAGCGRRYSCRVGDDVYINLARWRNGTRTYRGRTPLEYRRYVVSHEVGHWLGLGHRDCPGPGERAPVMQQQSKSLRGCSSSLWPSAAEVRAAAGRMDDLGRR